MQTSRIAVLACAVTAYFCVPAFAQVDRATLTGVVRDASAAVVPGATVTVSHDATGVRRTATATEDGTWLVVDLAPGEYLVEAVATGFQTAAQLVVVTTGQRARLDLTLAAGGVVETITVQAATPLLDTQAAALNTVVSRNEVANLPLAIRNWDDLLFTIPGVQGDRYTEQTGTTNAGRTGGVSVHGNRSLQNNFLLDGVDNNSISTNVQELSTQVSRPSIDAIDEFQVVTSPFGAQYGRAPGGAIIVTTKSGTNRLFGTAYDYYRERGLRRAHLLRQTPEPRQAGQRPEPVRRQPGRPDPSAIGPSSSPTSRPRNHPGCVAHGPRRDCRGA